MLGLTVPLASKSSILLLSVAHQVSVWLLLITSGALLWEITREAGGKRITPLHSGLLPFFIGIPAALFPYIPPSLSLTLALGIALISIRVIPSHWHRVALASLLVFICGTARIAFCEEKNAAIRRMLKREKHMIHAYIKDISPWNTFPGGTVVTLDVTHTDHIPLPYSLRFYVRTPQKMNIGDYWYMTSVRLSQGPPDKILKYLSREGISATFFDQKLPGWCLERKTLWYSWKRPIHAWRAYMYSRLSAQIPEPVFSAFSSLFLGNKKTSLFKDMKAAFSEWGIVHYLARSGLHLAVIFGIWIILFAAIPAPLIFKYLMLSILMFFYIALSWPTLSFYRALLFFFLFIISQSLGRNTHALHLFALVTSLTLIHHPHVISFLDFQLSFGMTYALLIFAFYGKNTVSCREKKECATLHPPQK